MLQLSFRNRIAFFNLLSTALLVFLVFVVIYFVVSTTVIFDVNQDLTIEVERHVDDVKKLNDTTRLVNSDEWEESEHTEIKINPVFVEILDTKGRLKEKSPNLKNEQLQFYPDEKNREYHDAALADIHIRQTQAPLFNKGKHVGYVIIAMSVEEPKLVLDNLRSTLFVTFPIVLLALFFTTRFIAGRSIRQALHIISTTSRITNNNFDERIVLPKNQDELYTLSETINKLLDRIENAIRREKQFTSDASHELRTPLAVVKGTLEVLIRKPREIEEYKEKIEYCINEVNRLTALVDQLLLLARFENQKIAVNPQEIALDEIILESLERLSSKIEAGNNAIDFRFEAHFYIASDAYLVSMIIENLLSNALKYSKKGGLVRIALTEENGSVCCEITDQGIGIAPEDLDKIYGQFYRSKSDSHAEIKGNGLGLSLVRRLTDLLAIDLQIESAEGQGTTAKLCFPK